MNLSILEQNIAYQFHGDEYAQNAFFRALDKTDAYSAERFAWDAQLVFAFLRQHLPTVGCAHGLTAEGQRDLMNYFMDRLFFRSFPQVTS